MKMYEQYDVYCTDLGVREESHVSHGPLNALDLPLITPEGLAWPENRAAFTQSSMKVCEEEVLHI